jgi:hypothetical protein
MYVVHYSAILYKFSCHSLLNLFGEKELVFDITAFAEQLVAKLCSLFEF